MLPLWLNGSIRPMRIRGKTVLITGASRGIGAACAREFRARGANVSLVSRTAPDAGTQSWSPAPLVVTGDLTDAAVRQSAIKRTVETFGSLDILINNAGVGLYRPASQAPLALVRQMFELNFFAALELIQLAVPHMKDRGGTIVNVGSIAGKVTLPWLTAYSASKSALHALSDGLRAELKPYGIRVTTVCPGHIETTFRENALQGRPPEKLAQYEKFGISAKECAEAIARGVERNARTVMTPRIGWALVAADRLFPSAVASRLARIHDSLEQAG